MKQDSSPRGAARPPITLHRSELRAIICIGAASTVASMSFSSVAREIDIALMSITYLYTLLTYIYLKLVKQGRFERSFQALCVTDAALIGFILSFIQFTVLPTLLFVIMIQFNGFIVGGWKKWLIDNFSFSCGVALTFLFWEPTWTFESDINIGLASIVSTFTYFCAYAFYLHFYILRLKQNSHQIFSDARLHKARTHKLAHYLTPTVWHSINEGREKSLKTVRKRITIFFSDIQGFSSLSEELESETVETLLNQYLTEMTKIVVHHKGNVDKFMGDGLMVLFGDSQSESLKADCVRCVSMAIEMRKKMKELQNLWFNQGIKKPLRIRMGINTGYSTVGTFGSSHYMDYTALGTHVNLASRLESAAEANEILVSHETWSLIKDVIMCQDKGEITVKGFSHPIKVYQVVDYRKDLGANQSYFEENTQGFSLHVDLNKIRNYEKDKIVDSLENLTERIKDKII
ncbi:MAG: adenylate/guanylate cyclase domain-containing protein [Agarilytica sp.]